MVSEDRQYRLSLPHITRSLRRLTTRQQQPQQPLKSPSQLSLSTRSLIFQENFASPFHMASRRERERGRTTLVNCCCCWNRCPQRAHTGNSTIMSTGQIAKGKQRKPSPPHSEPSTTLRRAGYILTIYLYCGGSPSSESDSLASRT